MNKGTNGHRVFRWRPEMEIPGGVKCASDQSTIQMISSCLFLSIFSISAALICFCLLSSFDVKIEVDLLPQLMLGLGSLMCLDSKESSLQQCLLSFHISSSLWDGHTSFSPLTSNLDLLVLWGYWCHWQPVNQKQPVFSEELLLVSWFSL